MANNTYLQLSAELEEALEMLQSDKLDLEQSIENYKKAMGIITELEKQLKQAENIVKKVKTSQTSDV